MNTSCRAFTLIELLVVIGIIALLVALVIPAFNSIGGGQNITSAADTLASRLELARQIAMTENERTELRLLKMPPADGANRAAFTAVQIVRVSSGQAIDNLVRLPPGVEVLDELAYSTLVSGENPLPEAANGTTTVSGISGIPFKAILFRADGSTHLSPDPPAVGSNAWTLTVVQSTKLAPDGKIPADGELPANFATVMIDPVTGRSTVYRP